MKILDNPVMYKYINNDEDNIQFIIDPIASERLNTLIYNQFINGLYTGAQYSQIEIHHLMDNGYQWITIH